MQGVGFRPFVYRLACEHALRGHVQNRRGEVEVVACGPASSLERFRRELIERAPPLAAPAVTALVPAERATADHFEILPSSADAEAHVFVPPDFFMCDDCRRELHDPTDRRYRYPFINCTQCGPRYTLIESLPYDRPSTSMAGFRMCVDCEREYTEPADRRFHAEPVACPACGPTLKFAAAKAGASERGDAALDAAIERLRAGDILAVRGIGGYHLMCDAQNAATVDRLRQRKRRPDKPFAVMFPHRGADGLDAVRAAVSLDAGSATLLTSPQRPIVLVGTHRRHSLADGIAPGLAELGVFLPYSPLHELLLDGVGAPLVATSGNLSGEPVLTDSDDADRRLAGIVDAYLHHDRPIVRPADDSVYRSIGGRLRPLRIGRGAAPLELDAPGLQTLPTLAVGGHMKNTVALAWDRRVVVSPHIGEMDAPRSLDVLERLHDDLQALYGVGVERIVCDAHPGYTTHRWAHRQGLPVETVWHHHAHASALAGEMKLAGRWLVFTWDGVGLGEDGGLWGGEALLGVPGAWRRVASIRPFRLPGGERAGREPWRSAAALHWECGRGFTALRDSDGLARAAWERELNCPTSTSVGRLFDAAASLVLGQDVVSFEAQGPMMLEALCRYHRPPIRMPLTRQRDGLWCSDWEPLLDVLSSDDRDGAERAELFHSSIAQIIVDQTRAVANEHRIDHVGFCGGVFQNRMLSGQAGARLTAMGFRVLMPRQLPCNDAGVSFGQVVELAARERGETGRG